MAADFVNGPKLAAWLKKRDRLPMRLDLRCDEVDWLYRRVYAWERGDQASAGAVDRWLTFIGCHLSELPDDFWEERRKVPYRRHSPEERREVLRLIEQGANPTAIARERGINPATVHSWVRRAAA